MKTRFTLLFISFFYLLACTKTDFRKATVIRDCTGTYLQINSDDYFVSNPHLLSNIESGKVIEVNYKLTSLCDDGAIHCAMLHEKKGCVKIEKIK